MRFSERVQNPEFCENILFVCKRVVGTYNFFSSPSATSNMADYRFQSGRPRLFTPFSPSETLSPIDSPMGMPSTLLVDSFPRGSRSPAPGMGPPWPSPNVIKIPYAFYIH